MITIFSRHISTISLIISLAVGSIFLSGCTPQPPEEKIAAAHKIILDARKAGADTLARFELSYAQDHLRAAMEGINYESKYFAPFRKYDYISGLLDTSIMFAQAAIESTTVRKAKIPEIQARPTGKTRN